MSVVEAHPAPKVNSSGDHIPLGGFVSVRERQAMPNVESNMRHVLVSTVYLLAIVAATAGWLWLLVWVATQLV
jgi:hypothetical protein